MEGHPHARIINTERTISAIVRGAEVDLVRSQESVPQCLILCNIFIYKHLIVALLFFLRDNLRYLGQTTSR